MAADYTVERIEPNEEGLELFLSKYKPFRLNALKTDPSCMCASRYIVPIIIVLINCSLWIKLRT